MMKWVIQSGNVSLLFHYKKECSDFEEFLYIVVIQSVCVVLCIMFLFVCVQFQLYRGSKYSPEVSFIII